jgi:hypothetical protein
MVSSALNRLAPIDFTRYIDRLTERFTGREWVFEAIENWLADPEGDCFFLLTGEPGIGKSAVIARLTQIRQDIVAYHFCTAGRTSTIEPSNVLLSLVSQLIDNIPGYAEAFVNVVKPLRLSVNVEININTIQHSEVKGVVVNNLSTNRTSDTLRLVLNYSLATLPAPQQAILILLDSLDEAMTFNDRENLVTLLAHIDDLPPWIRLILTSRPDGRVLAEFEQLKPFRLEALAEQNLSDIRRYIEQRVYQPTLQARLEGATILPQTLIHKVVELANGNFLYTKVLLNDIESGQELLDNNFSTPLKSIDDIYHQFLSRLIGQWEDKYQPIIGTLAVTLEPVTEDELANFIGIEPLELRQDLRIVRQFLKVVENANDETYAIFHQSFRDYLLDRKRNKQFWCDAEKANQRISDYYLSLIL